MSPISSQFVKASVVALIFNSLVALTAHAQEAPAKISVDAEAG